MLEWNSCVLVRGQKSSEGVVYLAGKVYVEILRPVQTHVGRDHACRRLISPFGACFLRIAAAWES